MKFECSRCHGNHLTALCKPAQPAAQEVAAPQVPFSKGYKHRNGRPVSDACGDGLHGECTQDLTKCHCTYRSGHKVLHAYMNPVVKPAEPSAPAAEIRSLTPEEHANLAAYYKGRYKKVGAASGQAGAGPSELEQHFDNVISFLDRNLQHSSRCPWPSVEALKVSKRQFFPVSAPASQPSAQAEKWLLQSYVRFDAERIRWITAMGEEHSMTQVLEAFAALSAPKAPAGQPEMRYTAREIISLIRSVEWEEEFMKADDESYIAFITGKLAQMEKREAPAPAPLDLEKIATEIAEEFATKGNRNIPEIVEILARHLGSGEEA